MADYKINSETIDTLYNNAEEVFGNISLIKMFCENYYEIDDFYKLKPLIKYTERVSDSLFAQLLEIKYDK